MITKSIVFPYKASWNFWSTVGISRFLRLLNHFSTKWTVQLHFLARPLISDCKKWNSVSIRYTPTSLSFILYFTEQLLIVVRSSFKYITNIKYAWGGIFE